MHVPLPSLASTEPSLHRPEVFDLPRKKPLETQLGARSRHTMCWSLILGRIVITTFPLVLCLGAQVTDNAHFP